jgi:hypothetical protein
LPKGIGAGVVPKINNVMQGIQMVLPLSADSFIIFGGFYGMVDNPNQSLQGVAVCSQSTSSCSSIELGTKLSGRFTFGSG